MSKGYCVPYTLPLYTPLLWTQHVAAAMRAPAPAPEIAPRAGLPPAPMPAPTAAPSHPPVPAPGVPPQHAPVLAGAGQQFASAPGPSGGVAGRTAEIEGALGGADAMPPTAKAPTGQSGLWASHACGCHVLENLHTKTCNQTNRLS